MMKLRRIIARRRSLCRDAERWEHDMHYRVYSLSSDTGRIIYATDLLADDDVAAVRHGRAQHPHQPFEIWCAARRVHVSTIGEASGSAAGAT